MICYRNHDSLEKLPQAAVLYLLYRQSSTLIVYLIIFFITPHYQSVILKYNDFELIFHTPLESYIKYTKRNINKRLVE